MEETSAHFKKMKNETPRLVDLLAYERKFTCASAKPGSRYPVPLRSDNLIWGRTEKDFDFT